MTEDQMVKACIMVALGVAIAIVIIINLEMHRKFRERRRRRSEIRIAEHQRTVQRRLDEAVENGDIQRVNQIRDAVMLNNNPFILQGGGRAMGRTFAAMTNQIMSDLDAQGLHAQTHTMPPNEIRRAWDMEMEGLPPDRIQVANEQIRREIEIVNQGKLFKESMKAEMSRIAKLKKDNEEPFWTWHDRKEKEDERSNEPVDAQGCSVGHGL